jgi:light-regulated signal transduction histidine kinase (bacteriophytochrome)
LPIVLADPIQLERLFQNLIGNALKYKAANVIPTVHISAQKKEADWKFSVKDNGIGIDPKNFNRIFQIFQRLHTTQEYPGTGIGLSVCQKIVHNHGGNIWVDSEPGKGSNFQFTISSVVK